MRHCDQPHTDWSRIYLDAAELSARLTAKLGCRSLDILHCAVARFFGASQFVTADKRHRDLAKRAGLHAVVLGA